jgi:hypothetical protein
MFKILGSTVALAVFALPLTPQAVFSQQATTQPSPTSNGSVTGATPVTGTTPVTGVNNPGNQNLVNSGAGATGAINQPLNQNQTSGAAQGNAAIAPVQVQVTPGQSVLLQVVDPNAVGANGGANLGTNAGANGAGNTENLNGTNATTGTNGAAAGTNAGNANANQAPRTTNNAASTTTINPGGVLNLSTATSDRPTASNTRNTQNAGGVGNQAAANTNNVLNNIQPANLVNGNNAANQGVQNSQNNQAFVVRGTLDAPLRQAVCAQNWQQATRLVNSAIAAAPATATQYRGQLENYREQLQTLQAANVRVANWQQQCGG